MLTKKQFKEFLIKYKKLCDGLDRINDEFKKITTFPSRINFDLHDELILDILELAMNDKEEKWIEYWIYELDWGRIAKNGTVKDHNKKNIPMKTIDNLYNALIKFNKK